MKLGTWSMDRDTMRRDGLALFSRLIRTKNVDSLQEQTGPRVGASSETKQKLTVSKYMGLTLNINHVHASKPRMTSSTIHQGTV